MSSTCVVDFVGVVLEETIYVALTKFQSKPPTVRSKYSYISYSLFPNRSLT